MINNSPVDANKLKFDNYVYMSICEITLDLYVDFEYYSYNFFCSWIKEIILKINFTKLTSKEWKVISTLTKKISDVYSLDEKTVGEYVTKFFFERKYLELEKSVYFTKKAFKNSFN